MSKIVPCESNGDVPVVCCPTSSNCKANKIYEHPSSKRPAHVGEFPFLAAIGFKERRKTVYRCSGALIADDLVLVAAHCNKSRYGEQVTVKLGKTSINNDPKDNSEGEDVAVQNVILHPNYDRNSFQNDIALIKLNRTATPNSKYIKPICLSANDEHIIKKFSITGFLALVDRNHRTISNWTQTEPVEEYPFQKCKEDYKALDTEIVETQFCGISPNGTSIIQSGPVSYHTSDGNTFLYGLTSYGSSRVTHIPDVYTKINQYIDWIYAEVLRF
ncbi:CLIP domain-containing serine protease B15-like [Chironomus tepperi]|uniref:CLIP domain-containing serine protease B15-like n=1 Tax=Chironomus tepperi TaxID=113505 RepID=UPI00391FB423